MPDILDDVGGGVKNAGTTTGKALGKEIGPFPVWGWVAILGGGGLLTYYLFFRQGGSPAAQAGGLPGIGGAIPPTVGGGTGSGSSGGGSAPPTATPIKPAPTNLDWLSQAVPGVGKALGMDPSRVRLYLEQYLAGRRPLGNPMAVSDFERAVESAIGLFGQAPNQPQIPNVNTNPFESNVSWLTNGLGFIPGVPGKVRQELINLVNGTSNTLSPEAQAALDQIRNALGVEPTPLSWKPPAPTTGPPVFPPIEGPKIPIGPIEKPPVVPAKIFQFVHDQIANLNGGYNDLVKANNNQHLVYNDPRLIDAYAFYLNVPKDIAARLAQATSDWHRAHPGRVITPMAQNQMYNVIANADPSTVPFGDQNSAYWQQF